jgi:hypothetical protein
MVNFYADKSPMSGLYVCECEYASVLIALYDNAVWRYDIAM